MDQLTSWLGWSLYPTNSKSTTERIFQRSGMIRLLLLLEHHETT
jgi:hypothetical protein